MTVEGGDLAAGHQEQAIEVGLQLPLVVVLGDGVVVGDGDEVKFARGRGLHRLVQGAGHFLAGLAQAGTITVRVVHVEVAAIPAGPIAQRRLAEGGDRRKVAPVREGDLRFVVRLDALRNVWNAEKEGPFARGDDAGKIGRRGVGLGEGEEALVASAPTAKPLRVQDAEVDAGVLVALGISKLDRDAGNASRHGEGNLFVRLTVGVGDGSAQDDVGLAENGVRSCAAGLGVCREENRAEGENRRDRNASEVHEMCVHRMAQFLWLRGGVVRWSAPRRFCVRSTLRKKPPHVRLRRAAVALV